jgi:hypothetical protein
LLSKWIEDLVRGATIEGKSLLNVDLDFCNNPNSLRDVNS